MIDVAVYNKEGKEIEKIQVDESLFGGEVRHALLKQALVMYHANKRVGTAATKSRGMVAGSTRKLFRQKGTGNARVGASRTHKRVGGGVAFAKRARDFGKDMNRKMRRLALDSALLAKMSSQSVVVVDELSFDAPKTKEMASILKNLDVNRGCLLTVKENDKNVYLSARNIYKVDVSVVSDLNAGDVLNKQKLVITKEAFEKLLAARQSA
ncbi:50S ribosomal protein L4 [Limihaloglobus sulfuriphilus]|uniref:Large ribosomal subunit protein uL4 n=1 Tax=Limihaloglobus sulfuriphilus TaxID=1851148 RepID=A0A1Q2MH71_9BACT|nr:50S ribosomal protein L4 [Limihaloglobus sulfuriphilus]AQQ72055.1 50S ribosomal protein L4 [Limihaloglobus sulfuriphilus]